MEPVITFTRVDDTHHRVHTVLADGSEYDVTVACNFDNGTCVCGNVKPGCGNVKPVCDHVNQQAVDNHDGTCSYVCKDCHTVLDTQAHVYYDGETKCARCGAEKPVTVCDHVNQYAVDNHDGTCSYVCKDCHTVLDTQAHVYYDGETKCARCGAEKPACDHMKQNFKFAPNNNGTHNVLCADCNAVVSENVPCTYVDGKCIQCGAEKPACDHMKNNWKYVDNGDGTHKVICKDCDKVVEEHAACVYTKGKCVCGGHKKVVIPDTDELDPSFSVSRYPICQFFQAVHQFFRNLFHRA